MFMALSPKGPCCEVQDKTSLSTRPRTMSGENSSGMSVPFTQYTLIQNPRILMAPNWPPAEKLPHRYWACLSSPTAASPRTPAPYLASCTCPTSPHPASCPRAAASLSRCLPRAPGWLSLGRPTLDFPSGQDLRVGRSSLLVGLCAQQGGQLEIPSLRLPLPYLSLSK